MDDQILKLKGRASPNSASQPAAILWASFQFRVNNFGSYGTVGEGEKKGGRKKNQLKKKGLGIAPH